MSGWVQSEEEFSFVWNVKYFYFNEPDTEFTWLLKLLSKLLPPRHFFRTALSAQNSNWDENNKNEAQES